MFRYLTSLFIAFLAFYLVGNLSYPACGQDSLSNKLRELDQLRNGNLTPFPFVEVESLGKELLNEYTKPEEQGQIYYHLAEVHGQSIVKHTDLIILYAQKALDLPVDPFQRFRLYGFWGRAIEIGNDHKPIQVQKPFYEVRKVAVKPYLEGLKEMQAYKVPEQRPNLPGVDALILPLRIRPYISISRNNTMIKWLHKQAEFDDKLWSSHRDLMYGVVALYSRPPYAATELRQIATKTLNDPAEVEALMKRIEDKGALKDDPIPQKTNAKTPDK